MGKASKTKQEYGRREKIAAQRAAAKRSEQRRNGLLIAGGAVIVVIAVVVAFVVVKTNKSSSSTPTASASISGAPTGAALSSTVSKITSVPTSATDAIGTGGSAVSKPQTVSGGTLLTSGGKPEMLYIGAEYCPYCAAERWAMIVALSRFGTFSGLQPMRSSASDVYASTPTWTFAHSTFKSNYVTFSPVEWYNNVETSPNTYTVLQAPTSAQMALFKQYDGPPYVSSDDAESFPFVDIGNKYLILGASYSPQVLSGLTWDQINSDMSNASSPVAQGIGGTANYMTAALCKLTSNQPSTACTSAIQSLESSV